MAQVKTTVIYGAQGVALGVYKAIKIIWPKADIRCFLVTKMGDNNASILGGIPVRELDEFTSGMSKAEKDQIKVLIGTPEDVMSEIEKGLKAAGLYDYERIDSRRWSNLMEQANLKSDVFRPLRRFSSGTNSPEIIVYKSVHEKDKELRSRVYDSRYVIPIQVGSSRAVMAITTVRDCIGDNISEKNGDYSELTGLYWIWKNQIQMDERTVYYGLAHYRRGLYLNQEDLCRLKENDIDVVLPYPMPYEPDMGAHHERYLTADEWNGVLQGLQELQPEYAEALKKILKQNYLYNYNIIVAKREALNDYCGWLFPLLFRIEEINNPDGSKEPNRYLGYVGETLETLYFMYNKQGLNIAHAGCEFLV